MSRRVPFAVVALLCLIIGLATASLAVGSTSIDPGTVWAALRGSATPEVDAVVNGLRVPRTVLGVVAGAALGAAGALTQAHTRNPVADPGLIGVTSGASLGVVVAMLHLGVTSPAGYVWFAVGGAVLAGAVVLWLASRVTAFEPMTTVVLTGAVLSALLGSATSAVLLLDRRAMKSFQMWSIGTTSGRDLTVLVDVAPVLLLGLLTAVVNLPSLAGLELGDHLASSLGRNAVRDRFVGLSAVVLLAGGATALCGTLGFIGLLAPHAARRLVGARPISVVITSALAGAAVLLAADVLGRVVLTTSEVSVGIMLALLGAPLFVVLARRLGSVR
ncbi:FecCD family ABC transporter permease [Gephyromycinifex aptenodytis]|uniref:FecCD family ABC transporter permease n=1 Tax=Gephyromycinifex aptenodytis TaxID=2716227 RepID=UPI0014464E02|nr:iron ABC transporter permease [Gephyromycinifex aptenodytis]